MCVCGYHQDCEPTAENMQKHFGYSANICPSCKQHPLTLETNPDKKVTITIMGEDELDTHEVPDGKDADGKDKKRKLTSNEKAQYRDKIQADIIKFRAME